MFLQILGAVLLTRGEALSGCVREAGRGKAASFTLEDLRHEMNGVLVADAESLVVSNRSTVARFHPGSRRLVFNGGAVWLNAPPTPRNGTWELAGSDYHTILRPLLDTNRQATARLRILLDPGHGGADGGSVSPGGLLVEKTLVLDIAERIADRLREAGMDVRLTRENDAFVALGDRTAMIREWEADLFISIHLNAADNAQAAGPETFVLPVNGFPATSENGAHRPSDPSPGNAHNAMNTLLGYAIQRRLPGRSEAHDRGVRRARFQVLVEASCPAVLVECGFVTNQEDARRLIRSEGRQAMAAAIAEGVLDCAGRMPATRPEPE